MGVFFILNLQTCKKEGIFSSNQSSSPSSPPTSLQQVYIAYRSPLIANFTHPFFKHITKKNRGSPSGLPLFLDLVQIEIFNDYQVVTLRVFMFTTTTLSW